MTTTYMADFEISSIACIDMDLSSIVMNHPKGDYSIQMENIDVEPGKDKAIMSVQVIFPSNDIEEAKELGREHLKEYLDILTFSTCMAFKIENFNKIADWTPGLKEIDCIIFNNFPADDRPYPVIEDKLLQSIDHLLQADIPESFRRVVKWFSSGVSAYYLDDKFQYFWFAIELLAEIIKNSEKVNDFCPKCHKALYCESCEEHPLHKPYPKQSIEALFKRYITDIPEEAFKETNQVRNDLMHGKEISQIEEKRNIEFSIIVDKTGQIAWTAIFDTYLKYFNGPPKKIKFNLIRPSTFCSKTLTTGAHIKYQCSNPDVPRVKDIPTINVEPVFYENEPE